MIINVIFCSVFNLFSSNSLSVILNAIIIIFALYAIIRIFIANNRLNNEENNYLSLVTIIREHLTDKNFEAIIEKINKQKIYGVVYDRFKALYSQKTNNVKIDLNSIQSVNKSYKLPTYHSPYFISNILIPLGLLGTIIGLAISLTDINDALTFQDINKLKDSLTDVLSGVNTAFSTTIMGIFWSIFVLLALNRSKKKYINLLDEIDSYFFNEIRKLFFENDEKEIDYSELLQQNLKLNNEIAEKLVVASKAVSSQYESLIAFSATLKKSLMEVIEPFKNIKAFQEEILGAINTYKNIANSISEGSNKITDKTDSIIDSLNGMTEQLKLQHNDVSAVINKNNEISNDFRNITLKIDETIKNFYNNFETLTKQINEVNKVSVGNMAQLNVSLKDVKEKQEKLLEEFSNNADGYLNKITENIDKTNLALQKSLEKLEEISKKKYEDINNVSVNTIKDVKEKQEKLLEEFSNNADGYLNKITENIDKTNLALQKSLEKLEEIGKKNYNDINDVSVNAITNVQILIQNNLNVILESYQKITEDNKKMQEQIINNGFTLIITKFEQVLSTLDKKIGDIRINIDKPRIEENKQSINNELLVEEINRQTKLLVDINNNLLKMRQNWVVRLWQNIFGKEK